MEFWAPNSLITITNITTYFLVYVPRKSLNIQTKYVCLRSCLTKHLIIFVNMKKKRTNPWTIVGIVIAIILLIYWLLAATILEEDENVIPILDGTEQVIP